MHEISVTVSTHVKDVEVEAASLSVPVTVILYAPTSLVSDVDIEYVLVEGSNTIKLPIEVLATG